MTQQAATARVHRFRDSVAVYIGDSKTVYLAPELAKRLATAIIECARDVNARDFIDSKFSTIELTAKE